MKYKKVISTKPKRSNRSITEDEVFYNDKYVGLTAKVKLTHGTFYEAYDARGNYTGSYVSKHAANESVDSKFLIGDKKC